MNLQIIKSKVEERRFPGGIKGLAETVGMTVQNLHRCVRENKIQAQDLERIATCLKVSIVDFFDERAISIDDHSAHAETGGNARTYDMRGASGMAIPDDCDVASLKREVEHLNAILSEKEALAKEKDERIKELKERIEELKERP